MSTGIALNTLTVTVLNRAGKQLFENPRFLRVVTTGPDEGKFCVARHGKGLIVVAVAKPDSVVVDSTATRVDLTITRASKLTDIGLTPAPAKAATIATPSDLPALIAKYKANIARQGRAWIENALTHTKDPVKREAMEIALGKVATPEAPKAKKGKGVRKANGVPMAGGAKIGIDVAELAKALAENGVEPTALAEALAKAAA